MAYPFQPWPTFGEFKARLCSDEFRCTFEALDVQVNHDGRDGKHRCQCFRRAVKDGYRTAIVQPLSDSQRVAPGVIRSVLARLGLPTDAFNLDKL